MSSTASVSSRAGFFFKLFKAAVVFGIAAVGNGFGFLLVDGFFFYRSSCRRKIQCGCFARPGAAIGEFAPRRERVFSQVFGGARCRSESGRRTHLLRLPVFLLPARGSGCFAPL